MGDITKNFSYSEFIVSKQFPGLASGTYLSKVDKYKVFLFATSIFQPLRDHLKVPIILLSGKRSTTLNRKVGGVANSDHLFIGHSGAVDFTLEGLGNSWNFILSFCKQREFLIKQLIRYFDGNFIHLSLRDSSRKFGEVLYCLSRSLRMYSHSLTEAEDFLRARDE